MLIINKNRRFSDLFACFLRLYSNEDFGELSLESAYAYYEYGNALLTKEEENPAHDVLGNVEKDKNGAAAGNDEEEEEEEEEGVY